MAPIREPGIADPTLAAASSCSGSEYSERGTRMHVLKQITLFSFCGPVRHVVRRTLCSPTQEEIPSLSFAKAFQKFEDLKKPAAEAEAGGEEPAVAQIRKEDHSFLTLLRNSPLMQMGDPEGRIVTGQIFHIVNDDLYVDFGSKFHCVVNRPQRNGELFVRGAKVKLRLLDLEMSELFLGAQSDVTLLEANAVLMGLIWSPVKSNRLQKPDENVEDDVAIQ